MTNLYRPELATQGLVGDRVKWEQDFQQFLKQQGRTLTKIPLMGYREIDFYTLYREVICWGGYDKAVHCLGAWAKIWKAQPFYDPNLTDGSFRLKKNYEKWLLDYERHRFDPKQHTEILQSSSKSSSTNVTTTTKSNTKRSSSNKHSKPKNSTKTSTSTSTISSSSSSSSSLPTTSLSSQSSHFTTSSLSTTTTTTGIKRKRTLHHSTHSNYSDADVVHISDFENDDDDETLAENSTSLRKDSIKYPFELPPLPLEVNSTLTILNFGTVILKAPFVDSKHIWPIGYKSLRKYSSVKNPNELVVYTCEIIDLGDRPMFCVSSSEENEFDGKIMEFSPSECWRQIAKRIQEKSPFHTTLSTNGVELFGLNIPIVIDVLKKLYNFHQDNLIRKKKRTQQKPEQIQIKDSDNISEERKNEKEKRESWDESSGNESQSFNPKQEERKIETSQHADKKRKKSNDSVPSQSKRSKYDINNNTTMSDEKSLSSEKLSQESPQNTNAGKEPNTESPNLDSNSNETQNKDTMEN